MRNFLSSLLGLMLCILIFAACGSSADEPSSSLSENASPSLSASASPSPKPTEKPTAKPTASPTAKPTASAEPTAAPTPEPTKAPTPEPTPEPEPEQEPEPEPEPDPEPEPPSPYDYVGVDVNTFYSVFGYPSGSDYGPSCLGDGQDGLLYYSGFVVVTYRDPSGYETVLSVG